jgi:hypothetical protein
MDLRKQEQSVFEPIASTTRSSRSKSASERLERLSNQSRRPLGDGHGRLIDCLGSDAASTQPVRSVLKTPRLLTTTPTAKVHFNTHIAKKIK